MRLCRITDSDSSAVARREAAWIQPKTVLFG